MAIGFGRGREAQPAMASGLQEGRTMAIGYGRGREAQPAEAAGLQGRREMGGQSSKTRPKIVAGGSRQALAHG